MTRSKLSRRLIAIIAATLLLACQSIAVVHACTFGAPHPSASAASEPCHDAGNESGNSTGDDVFQAHCQSQHASSFPLAELSILAAAALPGFTARMEQHAGAAEKVAPSHRERGMEGILEVVQ